MKTFLSTLALTAVFAFLAVAGFVSVADAAPSSTAARWKNDWTFLSPSVVTIEDGLIAGKVGTVTPLKSPTGATTATSTVPIFKVLPSAALDVNDLLMCWGTSGGTCVASIDYEGDVVGVKGTFSGAVSGTTGTFSSTVTGVAGTFSGAITGTSISGTSSVTAGSASVAVQSVASFNKITPSTLDVANIVANVCVDTVIGDNIATTTNAPCIVGLPVAPTANITFSCFVSTASATVGRVTLRACNPTVGAIDPATAVYSYTVIN